MMERKGCYDDSCHHDGNAKGATSSSASSTHVSMLTFGPGIAKGSCHHHDGNAKDATMIVVLGMMAMQRNL